MLHLIWFFISTSTYIISVDDIIGSIFISIHLPGVPPTHGAGQQVGEGAEEAALRRGRDGCERHRQQHEASHPCSVPGPGDTDEMWRGPPSSYKAYSQFRNVTGLLCYKIILYNFTCQAWVGALSLNEFVGSVLQ